MLGVDLQISNFGSPSRQNLVCVRNFVSFRKDMKNISYLVVSTHQERFKKACDQKSLARREKGLCVISCIFFYVKIGLSSKPFQRADDLGS